MRKSAAGGHQLACNMTSGWHSEPSAVGVPDDVLTEIFSRVPPLARCAAAALLIGIPSVLAICAAGDSQAS